MRERNSTTPRRRGPKHPLPHQESYNDPLQEPPYYTIDNTEDIYSTTLLPSQRCYVDPWDLENYDYVRKKIDPSLSPVGYYETSLTSSPTTGQSPNPKYCYTPTHEHVEVPPRMATTMPRNKRRSHYHCQMECCSPRPRRCTSGLYGVGGTDKYENYMMYMTRQLHIDPDDVEQNVYTGYGGFSSSSSTEPHSSVGEDYSSAMMIHSPHLNACTRTRCGIMWPKHTAQLDFQTPPSSLPPPYDYCNPYATLPCCNFSDCYECMTQAQQIYGASSIYGRTTSISPYMGVGYAASCTLGRPSPSSSLYSGIYNSKFGMSKKGLLQIDYSCSWDDLDRIMGRNY